jgi:hypothetical protein
LQAERAAFMARVLKGKTHQADTHTHILSHEQDLNVVLNNIVVYVNKLLVGEKFESRI